MKPLDIDIKINNKSICNSLIVPSCIFGGYLGGKGNYYLEQINNPQPVVSDINLHQHQYQFLGSLSGVIGVGLLCYKIKKELPFLYLIFCAAIACGLFFPLIFDTIQSLAGLHTRVIQLENENHSQQIQYIDTVQRIAVAKSPAEQKEIAIEDLSNIAKKTNDSEVRSEAIAATDATAKQSNAELKIKAIDKMVKTAQTTDDPEIIEEILLNLEDFANGRHGQDVTLKAQQALELLNDY